MMMGAADDTANLPTQIMRPLRMAAMTVLLGIIFISFWAIYAPLSTGLHASGTLISSSPSYEIQHPYGGEVEEVGVSLHQKVLKDQVLVVLDVTTQKQALVELENQMSDMMFENELISTELDLNFAPNVRPEYSEQLASKYAMLDEKLSQNINAHDALIENNQLRKASINQGIEILKQRRVQTLKRYQALQKLAHKGAVSLVKTEENLDDLLSLDGQINSENTLLGTVNGEIKKARLDRVRVLTQHRLNLVETLTQNNIRLPEIRRQILNLRQEVNSAIIRSPIDGTIVFLNFHTNKMFVDRGATILKLSKRLEKPKVLITIPTQAIDQVHIGMKGKLVISSLPQRDLPNVNVILKSISPDALKDENQQPIGYQATGDIAVSDLGKIKKALRGNLQLSTDMPVSVSLEGRKTTLYQYLINHFSQSFPNPYKVDLINNHRC